jgi:hypothetical protein
MANIQVSNPLSNIGEPIKAAVTLGDMFKESGLFGIKERAQGHVLALACITEGMSPFQLMRRFHIVEGRLTQRADAMLAEFKAAGGKVRWIQWDETAAKAEFEYQGDKLENVFSWEMAQKAKYPFKSDGGIKANPLLTSDYHLQSGSPGIDAGINVGLPFNGTAPDIGCYEYGAPPPHTTLGKRIMSNGKLIIK